MTKKLNKSDKIGLTGKKLKVAEMLANPEFTGTNKDIYEEVGISHDSFYKWIKDKSFIDAVNELIDTYTDVELGRVWKSLLKQCGKGDTQAIKLYFELKGKYKQEHVNRVAGEPKLAGAIKNLPNVWNDDE